MATSSGYPSGERERFLQRIKETVDYCVRIGQSDRRDEDTINTIHHRLDIMCRDIQRCSGILISEEEASEMLPLIQTMKKDIDTRLQKVEGERGYQTPRIAVDDKGHSKFDLSRDQLHYLSKYGFTAPMMSEALCVSESTVRRRLREFNITLRTATPITDDVLDSKVQEAIGENRVIGPNSIKVRLAEKNIFVTRQRVRNSCLRVDPAGCALRSMERKNVERRTYKVAGPNSLWHLDGNHKLIRWGIVIHGCIDGYSRMITFLKACNNNKATTVFDNFIIATKEFGLPSRIRCDHGVENVDVCVYMEGVRGTNRGSAIKGKSSHNQRIERLWVDVWDNLSNEFYDLFSYMEIEHLLDLTNPKHVFALHFIFLPRINQRLSSFIFQYNNHPLSTEHNRTPNQLFIQGILQNNTCNVSVQEIVHKAGNSLETVDEIEEYGIEQNEDDHDESAESLNETERPEHQIQENLLRQLRQEIDPLLESSATVYGVQLFQKVLAFLQRNN